MAATMHLPSTAPAYSSPALAADVYVRRRLVVGVALALLGALLWTLATWATDSAVGVDPAGAQRVGATHNTYIVQPGDTLWSIAARIHTDGDVRDTVHQLAERNGGSALNVGQRLHIG